MENPGSATPGRPAEERALHRLWRQRFQHDLPINDHVDMIRSLLLEYGVSQAEIDREIDRERALDGP